LQDTRLYWSVVIDVKSRDHDLIMLRVNLKPKLRKGNYLPGSYDVGRFQDGTSRESIQE
jgi:hypothetical protein